MKRQRNAKLLGWQAGRAAAERYIQTIYKGPGIAGPFFVAFGTQRAYLTSNPDIVIAKWGWRQEGPARNAFVTEDV